MANVARKRVTNPPEAALVDDLVAAALLLRSAAIERTDARTCLLYARAAARLEDDAAILRSRSRLG